MIRDLKSFRRSRVRYSLCKWLFLGGENTGFYQSVLHLKIGVMEKSDTQITTHSWIKTDKDGSPERMISGD